MQLAATLARGNGAGKAMAQCRAMEREVAEGTVSSPARANEDGRDALDGNGR
jgi:hypothetical protein